MQKILAGFVAVLAVALPAMARGDGSSHASSAADVVPLFDLSASETGPFPSDRFTIDDLYIPLTNELAERNGGMPEAARSMEHRAEEKPELDSALKHLRLVIVGDPGSGKSTYLKRIVSAICEARLGATLTVVARRASVGTASPPSLREPFRQRRSVNA